MGGGGELTKAKARGLAYEGLHTAKAARFPFPIEGRIPNFVGAEAAARRLRELPAYKVARAVKVNPDAPQLPVRAAVLMDGKTLYMPSPRLRSAFLRISPETVPPGEERRAASLSHCSKYGEEIGIEQLADERSLIGGHRTHRRRLRGGHPSRGPGRQRRGVRRLGVRHFTRARIAPRSRRYHRS